MDGANQIEGLRDLLPGPSENKPYRPFRTADASGAGLEGSCSRQYFNGLQLCHNLSGEEPHGWNIVTGK
jgi:hypothetical protein